MKGDVVQTTSPFVLKKIWPTGCIAGFCFSEVRADMPAAAAQQVWLTGINGKSGHFPCRQLTNGFEADVSDQAADLYFLRVRDTAGRQYVARLGLAE